MSPRIYIIDTNVVDWIRHHPPAYERVLNAVESGLVELRYTAVQVQEHADIPDLHERVANLLVLIRIGKLVNTRITVLDVAAYLDFTELSDHEPIAYTHVVTSAENHQRDGIIATNGAMGDGPLATDDRRLQGRASGGEFESLAIQEFVDSLPPVGEI